ncbi:hypothetical protein C7B61_10610 [filamentous cyanobacterium CCP1]|nr:hypothetical protein C7B76_15175 [filamentous cyanobacterium CCP2]PSB66151.1 hypothetical protein C7B61_10610 [filamentous cyanobacterium CCP1]
MANRTDVSMPPTVRRVAGALRWIGWISFWTQVALGIVSAVVLLFAGSNLNAPAQNTLSSGTPAAANPGTGAGLFFAVLGLISLFIGAYWAFRYTRLARQLKTPNSQSRPRRGDAMQVLRFGLLISLVGLGLTILGMQAIAGSLVLKSFEQGFAIFSGNPLRFITPLDLFVVQAAANTLMAHFVGLVATLWLTHSVNRQ